MNIQEQISNEISKLSLEEREEMHNIYFNKETRDDIKEKLEKIIFYQKPPTPEEFIDASNGWLEHSFVESIYPWVREEFLECTRFDKKYSKLVEYGSTRIGKTYLAILLITYTMVFIHFLREPAMYYGLSPTTDLAIYIISFKLDKTRELYLKPMFKMMENSPRFKQTKFQDNVRKEQAELGRDIIVYSKAATTGEITLDSGLQLQLGNDDALAFIGANLLCAYISEISFWMENAGTTEESIFRLYTDVSDRIKATVGRDYLTFLYLDTSANSTESIIEQHVLKELRYRPEVHFNWMTRWEALPHKEGKNFPKWHKARNKLLKENTYESNEQLYEALYEVGAMFKVITGNGNIPACIVDNEIQLQGVPADIIILVPIDVLNEFKDNLLKSIKDIAGSPTQSENKFISDSKLIDNLFLNKNLINIEGSIIADATDMPENLIWNQLKHKLFYQLPTGEWRIKRAPAEPRFIGLDTSYSLNGDATGITILHKEYDEVTNEQMYISDLSCAIIGSTKGINLEAVPYFLLDLITHVRLSIYALYIDTFQSETGKQFLERNNVKVIKQSVDREVTPYQMLLTTMSNGLIKSGRNIFLKNNLQCLQILKTKTGKDKVDHPLGSLNNKYLGDFEKSTCGLFAKDVSDSMCNAVYGAFVSGVFSTTSYQKENQRMSVEENDVQAILQSSIQNIMKSRVHY